MEEKKLVIELPSMTHEFDIPDNDRVDIKFYLATKGGSERQKLGKLILLLPDEKDDVWVIRPQVVIKRPEK